MIERLINSQWYTSCQADNRNSAGLRPFSHTQWPLATQRLLLYAAFRRNHQIGSGQRSIEAGHLKEIVNTANEFCTDDRVQSGTYTSGSAARSEISQAYFRFVLHNR